MKQQNLQTKQKSVGVAFLLAFLFGPLGLLYASVVGGIVMFIFGILIAIVTLGFGLIIVWIGCIVWAIIAANNVNKSMVSGFDTVQQGTPTILKQHFTQADLDSIAKEIANQEASTSGEIRVTIHAKRSWVQRNHSIQDLALKEFQRLKMQNTRDRSGVLLYFLFAEKKFYILADEGIHHKASELWEQVAAAISKDFKEGKYSKGICEAVRTVGEALQQHYPRKADDTNELSNEVELI